VVVDDASTDGTLRVVEALGDARVRIEKNVRNVGPVSSFEKALSLARNETIFFSDQDDVWLPGKVEAFRRAFAASGKACVVSDATMTRADLSPRIGYFEHRHAGPGAWKNFAKNTYLGASMAISHQAKKWVLPFPRLIVQHDEWIGLSCDLVTGVHFLPEKLILYRRHENTATSQEHRLPLPVIARNRAKYLLAIAGRMPALLRHRRRVRRGA
jgi:glycosyltransferase involved in cell wall biosynthesis